MLERRGETYLNTLTAEITLIDCESVFTIGEDAYPVEISDDDPDRPPQQSIRLTAQSHELAESPQEPARSTQEPSMHSLSSPSQTKRV